MSHELPSKMKAIRYNDVKNFELVDMPVPQPKAHEVLVKGELSIAETSALLS